MKKIFLYMTICFFLFSCDFLWRGDGDEGEPAYNAIIAWRSGLTSNSLAEIMVDAGYVYFYERPPGHTSYNIYSLTKLDAATGALVWRSPLFTNIIDSPPIAAGDYVYVFLVQSSVLAFAKETGELAAVARVGQGNRELSLSVTEYGGYLYFGLWGRDVRGQFARLNVADIEYAGGGEMQTVNPEILWEPETRRSTHAKPVIHNNVVYASTYTSLNVASRVELAGFDIDTKEMVFYRAFGGIEDVEAGNIPRPETGGAIGSAPLLIQGGVLYYVNVSTTAWDLAGGEMLYRRVFTNDTPNAQRYSTSMGLFPVYSDGKIYFVSGQNNDGSGFRNIHCIDAATGFLVWNDIAPRSASLGTNPVVTNGRLYVSQSAGLRVYEAETGRLIGADSSFTGSNLDRVLLYGDYMICLRLDRSARNERWEPVAVYVGK